MPNVLIRDLPEGVHGVLVDRAKSSGLSLQAYLRMELERLAEAQSLSEILAGIRKNSGGRIGFREALEALDEARAER